MDEVLWLKFRIDKDFIFFIHTFVFLYKSEFSISNVVDLDVVGRALSGVVGPMDSLEEVINIVCC
jgi:hypothetical protein